MAQNTIAIGGTFTVEPARESLQFLLAEFSMRGEIRFAPYNQIFQARE